MVSYARKRLMNRNNTYLQCSNQFLSVPQVFFKIKSNAAKFQGHCQNGLINETLNLTIKNVHTQVNSNRWLAALYMYNKGWNSRAC